MPVVDQAAPEAVKLPDPNDPRYAAARAKMANLLFAIGREDNRNGYGAMADDLMCGDLMQVPTWNALGMLAEAASLPCKSGEGAGEKPNRWYADAPKQIWLHGIGDPIGETTWAADPMPGGEDVEQEHAVGYIRDDLATVAAANDEGVADDLDRQVRIAAWNAAKKSGASDALGYAVVEAVVAEFAAIRLLSEGEGKARSEGWTDKGREWLDAGAPLATSRSQHDNG